jgi:hypothetical protein
MHFFQLFGKGRSRQVQQLEHQIDYREHDSNIAALSELSDELEQILLDPITARVLGVQYDEPHRNRPVPRTRGQ